MRLNFRVEICVKQCLKIPPVTLNIFLGLPRAADGQVCTFASNTIGSFVTAKMDQSDKGCFQWITKTVWI